MNFNDFKSLTKEEKIKAIESADAITDPLWMNLLNTAVNERSPQVFLCFTAGARKPLEDIYRELTG